MKIYAISDFHLSSSTPDKSMDVFGPHWIDHAEKISKAWKETVEENDLVLMPGDLSWAMKLGDVKSDLDFLAELPGRKILCKGNHDYWWTSASKVRSILPDGIFIVNNDSVTLDGVAIAGTRLWLDIEMGPIRLAMRDKDKLDPATAIKVTPEKKSDPKKDEKIFKRELNRLDMALKKIEKNSEMKIVLVHYPPLAIDLKETRASRLIKEAGIQHCVFGHLHNYLPRPGMSLIGAAHGVAYHLVSCDYLDFIPSLIAEV